MSQQVLAEVEIWHSRPITPTRRLALGQIFLPVDPAPGLGGILLGAIISAHIADVHEDLVPDVHRLIQQIATLRQKGALAFGGRIADGILRRRDRPAPRRHAQR